MGNEGIWRAVLAVAALSSGCARINSTTTYTQTPISRRAAVEVVAGSLEYGARTQLQARTLQLAFHQVETCRTTVVPVLRKQAHTRREVADDAAGTALSPTTSSVTGLLFAALGGYSYLAADDLAASSSNTEQSTPDDYRGGGLVLGAVGAGLLSIALIDSIRLRDSDEVVGEVDGPPEVSSELCHRASAAELVVTVRAPSSQWTARATTDSGGKVSFDLLTLDEAAFIAGALALEATLGGQRIQLDVPQADSASLLARLAAEPASKIFQDRDALRIASCDRAVAGALALEIDATSSDGSVDHARETWQRARSVCGDKWQPDHAKAEAAFQDRVEATSKSRALARCELAAQGAREALAQRLEDEEPLEIPALHADVVAACTESPGGPAVIAALTAKEQSAQVVERRREAVKAAADELDANLSNDDAVAIRAQLRNPDLAAVLRDHPQAATYFVQIAERWIGAMESGSSSAGVRAQLCASRALVLSFAGKARWATLRTQVAQRNDVVKAALLIRAMDGGGCQ